jgi:hypothetical protein
VRASDWIRFLWTMSSGSRRATQPLRGFEQGQIQQIALRVAAAEAVYERRKQAESLGRGCVITAAASNEGAADGQAD